MRSISFESPKSEGLPGPGDRTTYFDVYFDTTMFPKTEQNGSVEYTAFPAIPQNSSELHKAAPYHIWLITLLRQTFDCRKSRRAAS